MGKKEKSTGGSSGAGLKKSGGGGNDNEDMKRDQKLQAILLADSFSRSFRPVTWEAPKVLLPLVNVPMLEYTIEFLAQNGVEELFIFCVWHASMLEEYIAKSKWTTSITVRCITSTTCLSAGDALRELDSMGVIRSDPFILISGDVISNMDLKKAIAYHKEKRKADYNAILTVVLKEVQPFSTGAKPLLEDLIVGMDRSTSQLLLFEDSYKKESVGIPVEILQEHPGVNIRTDLLDCHVDICSPELMLQFSDNFDYQDIRRDFIRNEVLNFELGMHIYGYIMQNEYAARVHDPRTYHAISRDIVTRWVYPIVPEAQIVPGSSYAHLKRYVYKEPSARISRSAKIGESVVIGKDCVIEEHASVNRTIIGPNCTVGARSIVTESHLWEGAMLEADSVVSQAIICKGAVVKSRAVVPRGCIISYNVVIGEGVILPEYARVSLKNKEEEVDDWGENKGKKNSSIAVGTEYDVTIVGKDGKGFLWAHEDEDIAHYDGNSTDDDDEGVNAPNSCSLSGDEIIRSQSIGCVEQEIWKRKLWTKMPEPVEEEDGFDDEDEEYYTSGAISDDEVQESCGSPKSRSNQNEIFERTIREDTISGYLENNPADSFCKEVISYKLAQNKQFVDCLRGVVPSLLTISVNKNPSPTQMQIVTTWKQLMSVGGWGHKVLKTLIQGEDDELAIVEIIEDSVISPENATTIYPVFRMLIQVIYDAEVVSEEAILRWIEKREKTDPTSAKGILFNLPVVKAFVEWIQQENDDDEEDDDDDDEDEE